MIRLQECYDNLVNENQMQSEEKEGFLSEQEKEIERIEENFEKKKASESEIEDEKMEMLKKIEMEKKKKEEVEREKRKMKIFLKEKKNRVQLKRI
ncbi:hypothetical protein V6N12_068281 [Hibiscus sabdariffa]|uniref:Uncharacterized protein n=1 Tax=Hibiscus sabdariffa TaxID=183260 RepID=A0ABR2FQ04_9ROSI